MCIHQRRVCGVVRPVDVGTLYFLSFKVFLTASVEFREVIMYRGHVIPPLIQHPSPQHPLIQHPLPQHPLSFSTPSPQHLPSTPLPSAPPPLNTPPHSTPPLSIPLPHRCTNLLRRFCSNSRYDGAVYHEGLASPPLWLSMCITAVLTKLLCCLFCCLAVLEKITIDGVSLYVGRYLPVDDLVCIYYIIVVYSV